MDEILRVKPPAETWLHQAAQDLLSYFYLFFGKHFICELISIS